MINAKNTQNGFALLELLIALTIIGIITSYTIKNNHINTHIERANKNINKVVSDIKYINDAAGGYSVDHNQWPDFLNNCINAITTLTNTTPTAYIRFIDINSPYGTNYSTSCNTLTFTISIDAETNDNALKIANNITGATATATVVEATFPRPEEQPSLMEFLLRDGSRPMTGDLDMGGNAITNTAKITTDEIDFNGQDLKLGLGKWAMMDSIAFDITNRIIAKPNCSVGEIVGESKIVLRLHGFTTTSNAVLASTGFTVRAVDFSATQWQVESVNLSGYSGIATTYCYYPNWVR